MDKYIFAPLPRIGAWRLVGAYEGSEVVRFAKKNDMIVLEGVTVGVEDGAPWSIHYVIEVNNDWHFRRATVTDYTGTELNIQVSGAGSWVVNGRVRPDLQDCLDLDFEASAVTNTLPVHRLGLHVGKQGESAAAYIRTNGLKIERLDQTYQRLPDAENRIRFDYSSPRFGYHDTLQFDHDGLAAIYPDIALRLPVKDSGKL